MSETTIIRKPSALEAGIRAALAAGHAQPADPDPLTATISLAGPAAPFSREWLESWLREEAALGAEDDAAWEAILAHLPADDWQLKQDLDFAYGALSIHWADLLVERIAGHLPGLAPAIRAVYAHVVRIGAYDAMPGCCATTPES